MASMHSQTDRNRIAINLWTARVIPIVLAGIVGYATYVVVALLSGKPLPIFCFSMRLNMLTDDVYSQLSLGQA